MNESAAAARWYFLNSGLCPGIVNMAVDESLVRRLLEGNGGPTLRVYGWDPFAISLGYHQRETDVDGMKCLLNGIDVVKRPTGGRAIFHSNELTYCVVMLAEGKSIASIYSDISRALTAGLRRLGADVEFAASSTDTVRMYQGSAPAPCFSSTSRYEIQYRGKKLVGSAQRRYVSPEGVEAVLQHGSILLGPEHKRLAEFMNVPDENRRNVLKDQFDTRTTDLESVLRRPVPFDEVSESVRKGFAETWNIDFVDAEMAEWAALPGAEFADALHIIEERS
ncbi:MAG TPA: lipoate--protein ligase family protein [Bacteroidota bacterium]|nr:lipoate--protein ligase family protein [Bacteroidota bacterium]